MRLLSILACGVTAFAVAAGEPGGALEKAASKGPSLAPTVLVVEPEVKPVWRKKKYLKRIREERAVIVSVQATKNGDSLWKHQQKLMMVGGGLINAPEEVSFQVVQEFERLKKVSSYMKEVKYDQKSKRLYLHGQAFGYHAQMWVAIDVRNRDKDRAPRIYWRIIKGVFNGMAGVLEFKDFQRRKTEISMTALYYYDKLPVPSFFVRFGLEVILQKMATRVRTMIEQSQRPKSL